MAVIFLKCCSSADQDPDPAFYLNEDQDPMNQTSVDPDLDPGQTCIFAW